MRHERDDCGWQRITEVIPGQHDGLDGRRLRAALLTTYEPPDPNVLVEELLPQWLGMEHGLADFGTDENERLSFDWELDRRLQRLRGHFAVFSSSGNGQSSARNRWLWRYVRLLSVGRKGPATQHSKLWMFHWDAPASPQGLLQIVISSTNLTSDGLKGQIQAGWSATLPLESRGSNSRLKQWGVLPEFLQALGHSSGKDGERQVQYWTKLLACAEPPPSAVFVASVPGKHDRATLRRSATAWGAAGLAAVDLGGKAGTEVCMLVPTVGHWRQKDLEDWKSRLRGKCVLKLTWLNNMHPWSRFWQLPIEAKRALQKAGVTLLSLPATAGSDGSQATEGEWQSPLHVDHRPGDLRWCHAKLYRFRRGKGTRVLITSANFSPAAWGRSQTDGGLEIENFELGVLLRSDYERFDELDEMDWNEACLTDAQDKPKESLVVWADAFWNGRRIRIECRLSKHVRLERNLGIRYARRGPSAAGSKSRPASWIRHGGVWSTSIDWTDGFGTPEVATLKATDSDTEPVEVLIADNRQPKADDSPMIPDLAKADLKALELRLLEEDYGGGLADEGGGGNLQTANTHDEYTTRADYRIPAIETARRRWRVIDKWVERADNERRRYKNARSRSAETKSLLRDARRLRALWEALTANKDASSAESVSARAAASEMAARLKELPG